MNFRCILSSFLFFECIKWPRSMHSKAQKDQRSFTETPLVFWENNKRWRIYIYIYIIYKRCIKCISLAHKNLEWSAKSGVDLLHSFGWFHIGLQLILKGEFFFINELTCFVPARCGPAAITTLKSRRTWPVLQHVDAGWTTHFLRDGTTKNFYFRRFPRKSYSTFNFQDLLHIYTYIYFIWVTGA